MSIEERIVTVREHVDEGVADADDIEESFGHGRRTYPGAGAPRPTTPDTLPP